MWFQSRSAKVKGSVFAIDTGTVDPWHASIVGFVYSRESFTRDLQRLPYVGSAQRLREKHIGRQPKCPVAFWVSFMFPLQANMSVSFGVYLGFVAFK